MMRSNLDSRIRRAQIWLLSTMVVEDVVGVVALVMLHLPLPLIAAIVAAYSAVNLLFAWYLPGVMRRGEAKRLGSADPLGAKSEARSRRRKP